MPKQKTVEEYAEALRTAKGFRTQAAELLGVSHQAVSERIKNSKALQKIDEELKEELLDFAESKLLKAIKNDASWAICFFLKCKGKKRGYVERQEVEQIGGIKTAPEKLTLKNLSKLNKDELAALKRIQRKLSGNKS